MPSFRVLKKSFINNSIAEEGEVVEYDGDFADNLEPLELPPAEAAAVKERAKRESKARQAAAVATGDPSVADSLA